MQTLSRRPFLALSGALTTMTLLPVLPTGAAGATQPGTGKPGADLAGTGKPGDFDFLTGEWRIANRQRTAAGDWISFPGEATVYAILGGAVSIEELRIPERNFSGMGLRLLDRARGVWVDHWVNAKSGVVSVPGQEGVFTGGVGTFTSMGEEAGKPVIYRGVWDRITPTSCRWFQGTSRDGGASWDDSWFMDWQRV